MEYSRVLRVLQPFEEITKILSSDCETIWYVIPAIFILFAFVSYKGDVIQVSQFTISKIISLVSCLIASKINRYIKMPTSDQACSENKRLFEELGRGPGAIGLPSIDGATDCTHSNVPEWPGSKHDRHIFQNSRIYMRYRERRLNGMLIGDGGYPSLPFLLTPIINPNTDEEIRDLYQQLKKLWANLKQSQREALTKEKQSRLATGGGPEEIEATIDLDILNIAPHLMKNAPVIFTSNMTETEIEGKCKINYINDTKFT
ncbi:hypothetical protein ALC62_01140 [Cyphomyrmex costatus]|uniref:DDE Tnp4 domain-containing protein n=1 Tax=Cyphomyrmex costatus TaxID=456900 RepID=A0A151IPW7_9HYME|nr:hypothetical protein ALC62_01140 [Cyphomyrmex costatus]